MTHAVAALDAMASPYALAGYAACVVVLVAFARALWSPERLRGSP